MFWETGAEIGMRQVGGGEAERVANRLIVDGQQRLTSLFAVLIGRSVLASSFREQRIQIAFHPTNETFEVADAAIRRDPEFVPVRSKPGRCVASLALSFVRRVAIRRIRGARGTGC